MWLRGKDLNHLAALPFPGRAYAPRPANGAAADRARLLHPPPGGAAPLDPTTSSGGR